MTLLALREAGEALPAGASLLSPHADPVRLDGESYDSRAGMDPTGSREINRALLAMYASGSADGLRLPEPLPELLSPLRMELAGLPPLLVQAGDGEVLLSDAVRLAERARAAGVRVELEVWERMRSVFQALAPLLPEARRAIGRIGGFVRECLANPAN